MIPRPDRKLRQRFPAARPLRSGHLEKIAGQRRQPHAVVDPPQRPRLPRFPHRRRVHHPKLKALRPGHPLVTEQLQAHRPQPIPRLLQPLQQRHIGQLRQPRLLRSHNRLPQRVPASQMDQQHPQQVLLRLVLPQTLQSACLPRQLPPVPRKKRLQQLPVLGHSGVPPRSMRNTRKDQMLPENKLAPMGAPSFHRRRPTNGNSPPRAFGAQGSCHSRREAPGVSGAGRMALFNRVLVVSLSFRAPLQRRPVVRTGRRPRRPWYSLRSLPRRPAASAPRVARSLSRISRLEAGSHLRSRYAVSYRFPAPSGHGFP